MSKRVSFTESTKAELKCGFETSVEIPDGFIYREQAVSALTYPVEIVALANWDLPDTAQTQPGPKSQGPAWPRIDLMPDEGVLMWITRGDVGFDYETSPEQGDWFRAGTYFYLAPSDIEMTPDLSAEGVQPHPNPLVAGDLMGTRWDNANVWGRMIPVTDRSAERQEKPSYLLVYVFAGGQSQAFDAVSGALESVEVRFV